MNERAHHTERKPVLPAIFCLLVVFAAGLLLGALGNALGWNELENPWPYLGLLCPLLLGISVTLTIGIRQRDACLGMVLASFLAWIGLYLAFFFIPFHGHPYHVSNPSQPDPSLTDPSCSPCFTSDLFSGLFIFAFFPVGAFVVLFIAFASSSLVRFVRWRRSRTESR